MSRWGGGRSILTVIANENYAHYVSKLQQEYIDEYGNEIIPPKPANARNRTVVTLKKGYQLNPEFKKLWNRVAKKTKYAVEVEVDDLVKQCIREINLQISVKSIRVKIEKVELSLEKGEGIVTTFKGVGHEPLNKNYSIPNIIDYVADETKLTRKTIVKILTSINNLDLIFKDPSEFISSIILIIKEKLSDFLVNGIRYLEIDDWYQMELFKNLDSYKDLIVPIQKSIYDGVVWDSEIEKKFAEKLERMGNVRLFIKLPDWFVVETPIGGYNPDWAIVKDDIDQFDNIRRRLYFVTETKGNVSVKELRPSEKRKIKCAKKHFAAINVDYRVVKKAEELT